MTRNVFAGDFLCRYFSQLVSNFSKKYVFHLQTIIYLIWKETNFPARTALSSRRPFCAARAQSCKFVIAFSGGGGKKKKGEEASPTTTEHTRFIRRNCLLVKAAASAESRSKKVLYSNRANVLPA